MLGDIGRVEQWDCGFDMPIDGVIAALPTHLFTFRFEDERIAFSTLRRAGIDAICEALDDSPGKWRLSANGETHAPMSWSGKGPVEILDEWNFFEGAFEVRATRRYQIIKRVLFRGSHSKSGFVSRFGVAALAGPRQA